MLAIYAAFVRRTFKVMWLMAACRFIGGDSLGRRSVTSCWLAFFLSGAAYHAGAAPEPSARIILESNSVVAVGQFPPGNDWQEIKFKRPMKGRYFCLEADSSQDGKPYAAVAELEMLDESGLLVSHESWKIVFADSIEHEREDGDAENAIDRNESSQWHTRWSEPAANYPHLLVLDLGRTMTLSGFQYLPRQGSPNAGGRIKEYRVSLTDQLKEQAPPKELLPEKVFLFSYFTDEGADGLHLAWSRDGYQWEALNDGGSFFQPNLPGMNLLRDPCLLRGPDGTFHLVWTKFWSGTGIGYASSRDLIHWENQREIPVMAEVQGTQNCWAPEAYWDEIKQEFLLVWSSVVDGRFPEALSRVDANGNQRIYSTTTKDFKTFTPTKLFFDPGAGVIDPTIVNDHGRFHLLFKDETTKPLIKKIRLADGEHLAGPFQPVGSAFTPRFAEGPTMFADGDGYVCLFHISGNNTWNAIRTTDFKSWNDVSERLMMPENSHPGTVLEVSRDVLLSLWRAGKAEVGAAPQVNALGLGHWIWGDEIRDKQTCRFWKNFSVPADTLVSRATLRVTADNGYRVFLDGREIGRGGDFNDLTEYDLTQLLAPGEHVLAVEGFNDALAAGMILGLHLQFLNGQSEAILSDATWMVAPLDEKNWTTQLRPGESWKPAHIVGFAGKFEWSQPKRILPTPALPPQEIHFWQRGWFLTLLLTASALAVAFGVRQGLKLAVQMRSQKLLERERARIASDMHDDLGSGLTQLTLLGELALREMPRESEQSSRVAELTAKARRLLSSMDEIIWVVNPRRDTVKDFAAFISEHTEEFLAVTEIRCRQEVAAELPDIPLDLPQRRNLLLAFKESVRNAARHSGATEIHLKIAVQESSLVVSLEDNGKGFSANAARANRNGLVNMRERLAEIGGEFDLQSEPGQGCRITFKLPLRGREIHSRAQP
jgi:signal transduction histidine kinase